MADKPFSFKKEDFVLKAEKENAEARKELMYELRDALKPNLSDNFKGTRRYVNDIEPQFGHPGEFRDHSWIGIHFQGIFPWQERRDKHKHRKWLRDIPQFQVSLETTGLSVLLNVDHSSHNIREVVHEVIKNQKNKCFSILKTLDPDVTVLVKTKNSGKIFTATLPTDKRMEWSISKLQLQDMDEIIKFLSRRGGQFRVKIQFSESEAMKPSIVDELSNGLEKLYPLYMFLTKNNNSGGNGNSGNSGGNGNSGNSGGSIDEKFKAWLERSARKDGKSIEEYAKDLGKEEIEGRHKKFSELKKVLDEEPIDLTKISPVLEKAIDEHPTWMVLEPLEGNEISDAITALKKYKDETNIHSFLSIMNQARPPGREDAKESEKRTGLDRAQNLLIASVCLTALHPSKFVDFRENRWQKLAKLIQIEDEFTPVKTCSATKTLEEVGKFAKMITETPTFKKYWGDPKREPLWTLAGICWHVTRQRKMDDLVNDILEMDEFNLAIDRDVVKRIIRHLVGNEKNVVLVGAPGVGKTVLAKQVLKVIGGEEIGSGIYHEAVAHAEWTRRNVIGGLNLEGDTFEPGCVTDAAEDEQWLLIDEFNRADINKAFGEMFLGIESNKITLSKAEAKVREDEGKDKDIIIPEEFRMVCTMNDFDKNLLLTELSYGLITRFAFVDIKPDQGKKELDSIRSQIVKPGKDLDTAYKDCAKVIENFYEFIKDIRENRMIGVRTCIDVIRYTVSASKEDKKKKDIFLDEALCDYLWPQVERLDKQVVKDTLELSKKHLPEAKIFRKNLEERYKELKKLSAWMGGNEPEADDEVLSPVQTKKSIAGKKNSGPKYTARANKAVATMKFYRDNPKKINPATGLTGIEWAKDKGHDDPYGYSKKILGKDWKKYSKKK